MFVILVTTVPFYGVKEDISTGTGYEEQTKLTRDPMYVFVRRETCFKQMNM